MKMTSRIEPHLETAGEMTHGERVPAERTPGERLAEGPVESRSHTRLDHSDDWLEDCLESVVGTKRELGMNGTQRTQLIKSDDQKENKKASKPHSTPLTLKWLEENYEIAEGVCIPRSTLYMHYLDFCEKNDSQPVNAASFGKIIRQQFPHLTTRRLGTRGQSKYHYYGIGVKECSLYYDVMFSRKGIQDCTDGKKHDVKQVIAYSPRSKLGTLLPEFPCVGDIKLPPNVTEDKVTTFVMMYRTHCQRILDTVIRANFDEVQQFLLHFWQGMPQHMVPILNSEPIISLVGVCDSILYKAISGVLMPTVLQALPDSLTQVIRKFARQLDEWLRLALEDLPDGLRQMKFDLARRFAQLLKRQTSLNHLCQASRTVIHSSDITAQMLDDWANVDLSSISKQTLYTMDQFTEKDLLVIECLYKEFETLLQEQAPIEAYTEWLDSMVDRCVVKPSQRKPGSVRRMARQFLLMWSCFGTRVIRDMTLHSAPSFGSFHLLHLMFDDYVLYLVEGLHGTERSAELLRTIKGEAQIGDPKGEMILPNPTMGVSCSVYSPSYQSSASPISNQAPMADRQSVITDAREAYHNAYNMSPHQTVTQANSPSQSTSSLVPYDVRCESEAIQGSPCSDSTLGQNTNAAMGNRNIPQNLQTESYHRYSMNGNGTSQVTGDVNAYPTYPYSNSNIQYGYGREYQASRVGWAEGQRYGHLGATMQEAQGNYNSYPYSRSTDYDVNAFGYDESTYSHGMRAQSHHGTVYSHYGNGLSSYENSENAEIGSRKRKAVDYEDTAYLAKKGADYDFSITANGYQRT